MDEINIDLSDAFLRLLLKWRQILSFMLIFGIVFNGLGYVKKVNEAKGQADILLAQENKAEDKQVLHAVNVYQKYQNNYDAREKYLEQSIKMQIDPNRVPKVSVQYFIDNHYEVVYPVMSKKNTTKDIINSIIHKLYDKTIYEQISEATGLKKEDSYIKELIEVNYNDPDFMTINVIGRNQEEASAIAEVLCSNIDGIASDLKEVYGDFSITQASYQYSENSNQDLLTEKQNQISTLESINNSCSNLVSKLTEEQKKEFDKLIDQENEEIKETEQNGDVPEEAADDMYVSILQLKYLIFGLIAGLFLYCAAYLLYYIFGGKIRVEEDIKKTFHIPVIGAVYSPDQKKKIFGAIDNLILNLADSRRKYLSFDERMQMISSGAANAASRNQYSRIFVTGSSFAPDCQNIQEIMIRNLNAESCINLNAEGGKAVFLDVLSQNKLTESDAVILIEKAGTSYYKDIQEELEICNRYKVPVLGCVFVKEA